MSVRKELLERELRKLGFCKAEGRAGARSGATQQQQQQPTPAVSSAHPQADGEHGQHSG